MMLAWVVAVVVKLRVVMGKQTPRRLTDSADHCGGDPYPEGIVHWLAAEGISPLLDEHAG